MTIKFLNGFRGCIMKTKQRGLVSSDFDEMLKRGIIPLFETDFNKAVIVSDVGRDTYGIYFTVEIYANGDDDSIYDNVEPYFDGEIRKRKGAYYCTWANIDASGYSLDDVLQLFADNVQDGYSYALN